MEIDKALLSQPLVGSEIEQLSKLFVEGNGGNIDFEDEKRKKIARDFESIFIRQILDKMKDTIPESDLADNSSEQIQSMYWSFLGDAVADKGGFGLWKQIYQQILGGSVGSGGKAGAGESNSVQGLDANV